MLTSFSTALSALTADSTAIDVVGNNLANLNTPGFKASAVSFYDLVTQSMGAGFGVTQVGFGVGRPITLQQFTQGALQTTGAPLDVAIQGSGFFIAQDSQGNTVYTRGGNMQVDLNGVLTTSTGEKVQGWSTLNTDGTLNTNTPVGEIIVPTGTLKAPTPTQNVSVSLNLNAAATSGGSDGTFSSSVEVYDSLGNSHVLTFSFTKDPTNNSWTYSATVPSADTTSPPTPLTGTLTFDSNGNLTSPAATDPSPQIAITGLTDGASDMTINWALYTGNTQNITQFSQASAVSANSQDGSATASLTQVAIGAGGTILAQYSDGKQIVVGQMAMATIRNPISLVASGDNNYMLGANSALPAVGLPGLGGRGTVLGGSIESSTVDIATEFTNLIVYQRAYQANAKVITTVDQISQETINLKQ
ncbi:MAG TPA: flagellar hook protein FlgE [Bryobacteraceae bacterium]|jgi:flagellar hook protein FlgE